MQEQYETPYGPDRLTTRQAAAYLGMEEVTFRSSFKERLLVPEKIGGKLYFIKADLDAYIEESAQPRKPPKMYLGKDTIAAILERQQKQAEAARRHYHVAGVERRQAQ